MKSNKDMVIKIDMVVMCIPLTFNDLFTYDMKLNVNERIKQLC